MRTNKNDALHVVFSGPPFEAEVIRGMLETNGIRCIVEDHTSLVTSYYSGLGGDMRVLVSPSDAEEAMMLIEKAKEGE
jgi:hypothetical protein